jgi:hypothetical protein
MVRACGLQACESGQSGYQGEMFEGSQAGVGEWSERRHRSVHGLQSARFAPVRGLIAPTVQDADFLVYPIHSAQEDNTNRNRVTREDYIQLANEQKVDIRCIYFETPPGLAHHHNVYRAFNNVGTGKVRDFGDNESPWLFSYDPHALPIWHRRRIGHSFRC